VQAGISASNSSTLTAIGYGASVYASRDSIQEDVVQLVPEADEDAVFKAVECISDIMNTSGLMQGTYRHGPRAGEKVRPDYMIWKLQTGALWVMDHYNSDKVVDAAYRKGFRAGYAKAMRDIAQNKDLMNPVKIG